jgi:peptide/nickel transport system substrate-binding protein
MEYNDDYSSITFHLRPNMQWNDGTPLTSADYKFTYELVRDNPELEWGEEFRRYGFTFETPDDLTIIATPDLSIHPPPQTRMHYAFSGHMTWGIGAVPKHIWEDIENPLEYNNYPPLTPGPYELVTADSQFQIWERIDDWWGNDIWGQPAMKYAIFKYVSRDVILEEAVAGNIDIYGADKASEIVDAHERNPYFIGWGKDYPYAAWQDWHRMVWINCGWYPWNNKDVRRALSYAIDRDLINEVTYEGHSVVWNGWTVPNVGGNGLKFYEKIDRPLAEKYEFMKYDPEKAEEIVLGLGWTKGEDGIWRTENGTRVTMELISHGAPSEVYLYIRVCANMWQDFGIETTHLSTGSIFERENQGTIDAGYGAMNFAQVDPFNWLYPYHSKLYVAQGFPWQAGGSFWPGDPEFDELLDALLEVPYDMDNQEAVDAYYAAMDFFYDQLLFIPMLPALFPFGYNTYYWTGWPSSENVYNQPNVNQGTSFEVYLKLKSTGRTPTGIVNDPIFGRIDETTRNMYYSSIVIVVAVVVVAFVLLLRRRG